MQVRRTRLAWQYWRSKDERMSNFLLWTPSRPARTYLHWFNEDTWYSLENPLNAMGDRDGWKERVREIPASCMICWWWFVYDTSLYENAYLNTIYVFFCFCLSLDICNLPKEAGRCYAYSMQYHFNSQTRRCEEFVYGGCGGNANRFNSIEKCVALCHSLIEQTTTQPITTVPTVIENPGKIITNCDPIVE